MELLLADLRLGTSLPGVSEPAPRRAERGRGGREAVPGAGGEGGVRRGREGAAAALSQVQPLLLACVLEVKKPRFGACLVRRNASPRSARVRSRSRVTLSLRA